MLNAETGEPIGDLVVRRTTLVAYGESYFSGADLVRWLRQLLGIFDQVCEVDE